MIEKETCKFSYNYTNLTLPVLTNELSPNLLRKCLVFILCYHRHFCTVFIHLFNHSHQHAVGHCTSYTLLPILNLLE